MLLTVITIVSIIADIGVGVAAYKLARTVERNQGGHEMSLVNHEGRIKALEMRCGQQS